MFYSHEILTSREGGVATVWLVATLGSKFNSKRINRKTILNVNVPQTCRIIIEPEAPMALRLQSNLLYGVSRVFNQQCGYILSDAQIAQSNMRALITAVKTSELDPNAGKARPDQLVLRDDPSFLPDFTFPGLDIDLSALDISTDESLRRSSILSPHSQRSSLSSQLDADESMLGLIIPSSNSGGAGELGGFVLPEDTGSVQRSARLGRLLDDEDEGFSVDPGFSVDAHGNLIDEGALAAVLTTPAGIRLGSDSAVSGRIWQEPQEGLQAAHDEPRAMDLDIDLDPPRFDDEDLILPDAEAFPPMVIPPPLPPLTGAGLLRSSSEVPREHESSESAEAPLQRRRRAPKRLPVDAIQELRSSELAKWKTDYPINMGEAREVKRLRQIPSIAKKSAAIWVIGAGIGGVGVGLGSSKFKSPLDRFSGDAMMEALTGIKAPATGHERRHSEEDKRNSDGEAGGSHMKDGNEEHVGRAGGILLDDEDPLMISEDGIEIGRHAVAPLEDPSFPWNASSALGSRQGSAGRGRGFASSLGGFPTSAGVPSSVHGVGGAGPSSLDRRASRIPSASPLVGRGRERYSSLELPIHEDDDGVQVGHLGSSDHAMDDFQLYGPAAAVDTQTAADSQWIEATLDHEAHNFLGFVRTQIEAIPAPADEEEDELTSTGRPKGSVTFEELLPPTQHSKLVAAQALHHVLALATKGLLIIRQEEPYGSIDLTLPATV